MLEWKQVESRTCSEVAFDPENDVIHVRFLNGGHYEYDRCPPHVWEEFTAPGQSCGKFVHRVLSHKPYRKVS